MRAPDRPPFGVLLEKSIEQGLGRLFVVRRRAFGVAEGARGGDGVKLARVDGRVRLRRKVLLGDVKGRGQGEGHVFVLCGDRWGG